MEGPGRQRAHVAEDRVDRAAVELAVLPAGVARVELGAPYRDLLLARSVPGEFGARRVVLAVEADPLVVAERAVAHERAEARALGRALGLERVQHLAPDRAVHEADLHEAVEAPVGARAVGLQRRLQRRVEVPGGRLLERGHLVVVARGQVERVVDGSLRAREEGRRGVDVRLPQRRTRGEPHSGLCEGARSPGAARCTAGTLRAPSRRRHPAGAHTSSDYTMVN